MNNTNLYISTALLKKKKSKISVEKGQTLTLSVRLTVFSRYTLVTETSLFLHYNIILFGYSKTAVLEFFEFFTVYPWIHSKKFYPYLTPLSIVEMEVHTKKCGYSLISGPLHLGPKFCSVWESKRRYEKKMYINSEIKYRQPLTIEHGSTTFQSENIPLNHSIFKNRYTILYISLLFFMKIMNLAFNHRLYAFLLIFNLRKRSYLIEILQIHYKTRVLSPGASSLESFPLYFSVCFCLTLVFSV
jgi:hypothetical protein